MMMTWLDLGQSMFWTVDGLIDEATCRVWIDRVEAAPRELATINTHLGQIHDTSVRNNTRVIVDDVETVRVLWPLVREHVPERFKSWRAVGLNERLRLYRYEPGQYFAPHHDGAFVRNEDERSMITVLIYLNGDFSGGETNLLDYDTTVVPEAGRVLFFQHPVLHEGAPLVSGTKYVLRTDVMYRR